MFSYRVYGDTHKGGYDIVNCNPWCPYCPLVPKRDTSYVTDGSPMPWILLYFFDFLTELTPGITFTEAKNYIPIFALGEYQNHFKCPNKIGQGPEFLRNV